MKLPNFFGPGQRDRAKTMGSEGGFDLIRPWRSRWSSSLSAPIVLRGVSMLKSGPGPRAPRPLWLGHEAHFFSMDFHDLFIVFLYIVAKSVYASILVGLKLFEVKKFENSTPRPLGGESVFVKFRQVLTLAAIFTSLKRAKTSSEITSALQVKAERDLKWLQKSEFNSSGSHGALRGQNH